MAVYIFLYVARKQESLAIPGLKNKKKLNSHVE